MEATRIQPQGFESVPSRDQDETNKPDETKIAQNGNQGSNKDSQIEFEGNQTHYKEMEIETSLCPEVQQPQKSAVKYKVSTLWCMIINSSLNALMYGYQLGCFNITQDAVAEMLNWGDSRLALISVGMTLVSIGGMVGSLFGLIANRIGRRKFLMCTAVVCICGAMINCIPTTPTFMIGRFIGGFISGCGVVVSPLYNAEFSPQKMRGPLGNLFQVQAISGVLLAYIISLPILWLNQYWLIFVFAFPIIPALIQTINFAFFYRNEPYLWLLSKERFDHARKAIAQVYLEEYVSEKYDKKLLKSQNSQQTDTLKLCQLFTQFKKFKILLIAIGIASFKNLSGIMAVFFYSTKIFTENGHGDIAPYLTIMVGVVNLVPTFAAIRLIQLGRRPILIIGYGLLAVLHFAVGIFAEFAVSFEAEIVLIMLWCIVYELSVGPLTWTYVSEIMSVKSMSIAMIINWLVVAMVGATTGYIVEDLGIPKTFYIFGTFWFAAFLFSLIWVFETKHLSKQELRSRHLSL